MPKQQKHGLPYVTASLGLVLVVSFLVLSGFTLFPPEEAVRNLEVSVYKPQNLFFYVFAHTGYSHLIGNLVVILASGMVLEQRLKRKDTIAIFLFSSTFAGLLFAAINNDYSIIGSSAGAIALITAAFALEPKKLAANFVVLMLIGYALIHGINYYVDQQEKQIIAEAAQLEEAKQSAEREENFELTKKAEEQITKKRETLKVIEKGEKLKETPPNFEIHLFAALFSFSYLSLFRKKELLESIEENWQPFFKRIGIN